MKSGTVKLFLLIIALIAILFLSLRINIRNSGPTSYSADEKLVVITPHWDGIRNEFSAAFTKWYKQKTGRSIYLEFLDPGGTSDCIRYIKSEFKRRPDGIGVDLFFGGGTDPYLDLKKAGILAPLQIDSSILVHIPQNVSGIAIYDSEYYWYGAVLSGFGIIYNKWVTEWLKFKVPSEWKDLADPAYASWIGVADPRNSGTMHIMFEIILQAYGWEEGWKILTGIAANSRTFSRGASDVPRMVSKGDMAFGLAIDFYGWAEVSEAGEEKVGFLLPENLTVISADAMGMLKGAPNQKAARLFIEFVLSEQGQKIWFLRKGTDGGPVTQELNRMPVRPDLYAKYGSLTNVRQNPFLAVSTFHFDHELASQRWAVVNDLFGAALIDFNSDLQKAWTAAGRAPANDLVWKQIPVTERACLNLAIDEWNDPVRKNRILLGWHNFYEQKYQTLFRK